jgi:hypothetical protein
VVRRITGTASGAPVFTRLTIRKAAEKYKTDFGEVRENRGITRIADRLPEEND